MDPEEEKYSQDEGFFLLKEVFLRRLYEMENIKIPFDDAEETFLSLWIYLKKKTPHINTDFRNTLDLSKAENFYEVKIDANGQVKNYLNKLLTSFQIDPKK